MDEKNKHESVNEFFNNLPKDPPKQDIDIFGTKKQESTPVINNLENQEEDNEEVPENVKNRRHRRLESKLQAEREANIALSERIKVLSEMEKFAKDTPEVDPEIAKMFEANDIGKENALRLSKKFAEIEERAERRAIERIKEIEQQERDEYVKADNFIDSELERLEDAYGITLTPGTKQTTEFLQLVEELSPKDEYGEITNYADFEKTFEIYQNLNKKEKPDNSRQRQITSRSMQRSQNSAPVVKPRTPGWEGWKTDMGLE